MCLRTGQDKVTKIVIDILQERISGYNEDGEAAYRY